MGLMEPLSRITGLPREVMPLTILSPLSGSGSLTMFQQILRSCGPDSFAGRVASVMDGLVRNHFLCGYGILWRGGREKNAAYDPRGPLC